MNVEQMTERVQLAITEAQSLARKESHQEIDDIHLFMAILHQQDNLMTAILNKLQKDPNRVSDKLAEELKKKPQVSFSGSQQGTVYITAGLQQLLMKAEEEMRE